MKNFKMKINTNRKPISSQEIGSMQNFGAVLKGAQAAAVPFYKKWWFAGGAGIAVVAAIVVAVAAFNKTNEVPNTLVATEPTPANPVINTQTQQAFIQPAFKGFDVDFNSFWVESGKAKNYTMPNGSKIKIAPCHFTDEEGNPVQGDVEIRYREMNDPVDFAVSGIPMTYDSAGQKYVFESAGMFELQGWKNGKQVFINPDCPVTVEQKTVSTNGKFNMYYLDTAKRNWQYVGKPNWIKEENENAIEHDDLFAGNETTTKQNFNFSYPVDANDSLNKALEDVLTQIVQIETKAPKAPLKMDDSKQNFTIAFDAEKFPEFVPFTNTVFGVADEKNFTPALYKYRWNSAQIEYTHQNTQKVGGDSVAADESFTIYLGSSTYIGHKIVSKDVVWEDAPKDRYKWYEKAWRSIQKFFGKKFPEERATIKGTEENTSTAYKRTEETFMLIPVDSSQYFYQRSDYRSPVSFKVFPVLSDEQYAKAMKEFDEKMEEHKKLLQQKKKKEEEIREAIKERNRLFRENWMKKAQLEQQEKYRKLKQQGIDSAYVAEANHKAQSNNIEIRNAFAVSNFGVYNCDFPLTFKNPVTTTVNFKTENGKAQYVGNGFIIVKNKNALINTFYNNCCGVNINFIDTDENTFFTVLPDDRVAYYAPNKFTNLPNGQTTDMVLQVSEKKMNSVKDIKAFLGVTKNTGLQQ